MPKLKIALIGDISSAGARGIVRSGRSSVRHAQSLGGEPDEP
jgi:hypothetical protein